MSARPSMKEGVSQRRPRRHRPTLPVSAIRRARQTLKALGLKYANTMNAMLSIVIPTYRENENLPYLIDRIGD